MANSRDVGRRRVFRGYVLGLAAWALAFTLALKLGAIEGASVEIIAELRLPRAILATAIGMALAVAGAVLQALFANPLCEPYTLGVSSGSAFGAVLGASLGLNIMFWGLGLSAFAGALLFMGVLYLISLRPGVGNLTLLLAGVMLTFLGSSLVALWMALADANGLQGALVWLLGDLSRARLEGSLFALVSCSLLSFSLWAGSRHLDGMLMGEEGALSLGIQVDQVRRRLIIIVSLLVGLSVSAAGMIGFLGLIVPHFARKVVGSMHYRLLPLCAIWGAAALTFADMLARVVARPYELPAGVVTALIGAPLFLWVMLERPKSDTTSDFLSKERA